MIAIARDIWYRWLYRADWFLWFTREVKELEPVPKWMGLCWRMHNRCSARVALIPFNFVASWVSRGWYGLAWRWLPAAFRNRELRNVELWAYNAGMLRAESVLRSLKALDFDAAVAPEKTDPVVRQAIYGAWDVALQKIEEERVRRRDL